MNIWHRHTIDGGFLAGVTGTNIVDYAYPSSPFAEQARRNPETVAKGMVLGILEVLPTYVRTFGYENMRDRGAHMREKA